MSAGDLAAANVLARKPSLGVLSQDPGEVDKEADRQDEPDRALELAIRLISENEWSAATSLSR
jgi:hypothetical protein